MKWGGGLSGRDGFDKAMKRQFTTQHREFFKVNAYPQEPE